MTENLHVYYFIMHFFLKPTIDVYNDIDYTRMAQAPFYLASSPLKNEEHHPKHKLHPFFLLASMFIVIVDE